MATADQSSGGIMLDTSLILRSIKYYAVIGAGLGLLGIILLLQLGDGSALAGGILSMIILSFAVLSGPLIAAFIGFATASNAVGGVKQRSVNSGIANGAGFAVFGVVVAILLWIGLAIALGGGDGGSASSGGGGGGPIDLGQLISLITLMALPNAFVGGAITFFLEGRGATTPR